MQSMELCILLLSFFWTVSSIRNDYAQYRRYIDQISFFDPSEYYPHSNKCASNSKVNGCVRGMESKIRKSNSSANDRPHWISPTDRKSPNCLYDVRQIPTSSDTIFLHLKIQQYNCTNPEVFNKYPGGSSFYILSEGLYQQMCEVYDRFTGIYDVICFHQPLFMFYTQKGGARSRSLPIRDLTRYQSTGFHYEEEEWLQKMQFCQFITIILDFEHYDAFSEYGSFYSLRFPLLYHFIHDRVKYCIKEGKEAAGEEQHQKQNKKNKKKKLQATNISTFIATATTSFSSIPTVEERLLLHYVHELIEDDREVSNEITNGFWKLQKEYYAQSSLSLSLLPGQIFIILILFSNSSKRMLPPNITGSGRMNTIALLLLCCLPISRLY